MALKTQSSFSGGELDPVVQDRTTFEKYQDGLKTGRNAIVGKSGRLVSRSGRTKFVEGKLADRRYINYSPPNSGYLIEWGHLYWRTYDFDGTLLAQSTHLLTEDDLDNVQFATGKDHVFVTCEAKTINIFTRVGFTPVVASSFFTSPVSTGVLPIFVNCTVTGSTGYDVEYIATFVIDGQESVAELVAGISTGAAGDNLPIAAGQSNLVQFKMGNSIGTSRTEMKVYRRPTHGGNFGYIGSSTYRSASGGGFDTFDFIDLGGEADYDHNPPKLITVTSLGANESPETYLSNTATMYQQRLLLTKYNEQEAILASRPGYPNNFTREYPLSADSALKFRAGSEGYAKILRLLDNDGLVAFTNVGVFLSSGALSPTNLGLDKKGHWIIDNNVAPLGIPGGALFVDRTTNTIRVLAWSTEAAAYSGNELSTYSNHLFRAKRVVSWAFEEGDLACMWVVLDDGSFVSFTYEPNEKMNAWMRHDSDGLTVEHVCGTTEANKTFFVVEKDGTRWTEMTVPRYISGATLEDDPEAYMGHSIAMMDSMVSFRTLLNDLLAAGDTITATPVVADDWTGNLRLTAGASNVFAALVVGDVLRIFDSDKCNIDMKVVSMLGPRDITVEVRNDATFPSELATTARYNKTGLLLTGLDHLEGEYPAIIVDGYVVSSPNNDAEKYAEYQVVGGQITLQEKHRLAIGHVGRPVTSDIETLDIDTVEQRPVFLESKIVNKVYVNTYLTRGLFAGSSFPADNKVAGMENLEQRFVTSSDTTPIVGNRFRQPYSKRHELSIQGDWKSNGRVCMRQVDPIHYEILSIIPDLEDQRR